jgi:hypothetical protein
MELFPASLFNPSGNVGKDDVPREPEHADRQPCEYECKNEGDHWPLRNVRRAAASTQSCKYSGHPVSKIFVFCDRNPSVG